MTTQAISTEDAPGAMPATDPAGDRPAQARALRSARASRHMTQETLASAAGVSSRTVIRAERGDEITVENLRAICAVLDIDAMALVGAEAPAPSARIPAPDGAGVMPDAGLPENRTVARRLRRFMTWRWAAVALIAPFVAYPLTDYAVGRVSAALHLDAPLARLISVNRATVVAGRVNLVLGKLSRGEVPSASDMGPGWDFVMNWCRSPGPLERSETCGVSVDTRMVIRRLDGDGLDLVVGPVDDAFLEALALQLAAPRGISLKASLNADDSGPPPGALWFDPRGVDPRNLPRIVNKMPYLSIRIQRGGPDR